MKKPQVDWAKAVKPLIKKYKDSKHPLEAKNLYQMLVMVVLSAQTTDALINQIKDELFKAFPNMKALSGATPEALIPYITKVRNFRNKAKWLTQIAALMKKDSAIPLNMDELVALPGIGRKSANVIKFFAGAPFEGIVVDLHVVRVAQRLGIATADDPGKIEQQIMDLVPREDWEVGMSLSFLGRDICRPTPDCPVCPMNKVCAFYNGQLNGN
ncbi:MAG TPA: endonuclease III [Panacibacter sp.]|nr:endonuclease III [Panacibacter sp.]HNP46814.1 endonuclease III [Panacibacter sp.]